MKNGFNMDSNEQSLTYIRETGDALVGCHDAFWESLPPRFSNKEFFLHLEGIMIGMFLASFHNKNGRYPADKEYKNFTESFSIFGKEIYEIARTMPDTRKKNR